MTFKCSVYLGKGNVMKRVILGAISALAFVASVASAQAATVVQSYSFPSFVSPHTATFQLSGFDSTLGSLTGVELQLTNTSTPFVEVYNPYITSETITGASVSVPLTVTVAGTVLTATESLTGVSGAAAAAPTLGSVSVTDFIGSPTTVAVSTSLTSASDLAAFIGSAPITFTWNIDTGSYAGTAKPGVAFTGGATSGGDFKIIYTYAAVPEASIWAMLIVGFGLTGLMFRFGRNKGLLQAI